mmetsp:Transcript_14064/g.23385  ORF Transcript_14064/g.23385 Transcript_14064/m.23385 type:complete len:785 (+) Transcript_14064:66-2420(+)
MMNYLRYKEIAAFLVLALAISFSVVHADTSTDDCPCCQSSAIEASPDWVNYGGIIILLITVIAMFWALALVCEEFFVPALNILCEEWKIPDDVAGATFMAAGASSPELFTSFIGLIIYNSNIGVGTVVGSEIFNHMIISSGSVLFAKNGTLYLDSRIVLRDLFFYMVSMLILIYSLKNEVFQALPLAFSTSAWDDCLSVTTLHGGVLVLLYGCYAVVAGNYQRLTRNFCPRPEEPKEDEAAGAAENDPDRASKSRMSRMSETSRASRSSFSPHLVANAPRAMFREGPMYLWETDPDRVIDHPADAPRVSDINPPYMMRASEIARMTKPDYKPRSRSTASASAATTTSTAAPVAATKGIELKEVANPMAPPAAKGGDAEKPPMTQEELDIFEAAKQDLKDNFFKKEPTQTTRVDSFVPAHLQPTAMESLWLNIADDLPPSDLGVMEQADTVLRCYLSVYQDCIGLDALPAWMTWQLRYFSIDQYGFHSIKHPDDERTGPHVELIDLSTATSVAVEDPNNLLFCVHFSNEVAPKIQFRAPTQEIMEAVMKHLAAKIEFFRPKTEEENNIFFEAAQEELWVEVMHGEDGHHGHSLIDPPKGRYAYWWFAITFVLRFMFHYTLLDVRQEKNRSKYGLMIGVCTGYLAMLSYIMILCCNYIGDFIGTTPTVMGLTLSAVGTSFPNLWSSMVVARQGYGNMAICNALGSNIFNICVALGLPWFVFLLIRAGKPYDEMKDHGIVMFVVLLEAVCVIWIGMIVGSGFRMLAWMAPIFIVIYFIVLITAVALS